MPNETPGAPAPIASVDKIAGLTESALRQDVEQMTPEQIAKVLDEAEVIIPWLKSVETYANKLALEQGVEIPGRKIVEGRKGREWTVTDLKDRLQKLYGLGFKKADVVKEDTLSPAQIDSLAKTRLSKRKYNTWAALWTWKPGKPTLAPIDDPRPAIRGNAAEAFDVVTEEAPAPEPVPQTFGWE